MAPSHTGLRSHQPGYAGTSKELGSFTSYLGATVTVKVNKIALRGVGVHSDFNPPAHLTEGVL